jgi:hypothetical protein
MLSKCANPSCLNEFHYFGEGKVFEIRWEGSSSATHGAHGKKRAHIEHYWLCSHCASTLTIALDSARNILIIPRPGEDADRAIA